MTAAAQRPSWALARAVGRAVLAGRVAASWVREAVCSAGAAEYLSVSGLAFFNQQRFPMPEVARACYQ